MHAGSTSRARWIAVGIVITLVAQASGTIYRLGPAPSAAAAEQALTLDPNLFQGETRAAYQVAKEHPELLAQLDCYCGCEQHEGHKNLLDCFRTNHGAGCDICAGEAVAADKLADGGMPVEQIRQALHDRYAHGS